MWPVDVASVVLASRSTTWEGMITVITPDQFKGMSKRPLRAEILAALREDVDASIAEAARRGFLVVVVKVTRLAASEAEVDAVINEYQAAGWGVRRVADRSVLCELFIPGAALRS